MNTPALTKHELSLIGEVVARHPEVSEVRLFGSRAKGACSASSDVDLAVWGDVDELRAEAIAAELDELPLPYRFDVVAFGQIKLKTLQEHIARVGIPLFQHSGTAKAR